MWKKKPEERKGGNANKEKQMDKRSGEDTRIIKKEGNNDSRFEAFSVEVAVELSVFGCQPCGICLLRGDKIHTTDIRKLSINTCYDLWNIIEEVKVQTRRENTSATFSKRWIEKWSCKGCKITNLG